VLKGSEHIKQWNNGEIQMMVTHAASAGHGLNLQYGGNLIEWFGVDWSLELYLQAVARLDRQGQTKPVINSRIIAKGTIDEDVLAALAGKTEVQDAVMDAVKARIKKYRN
jgi:SNF2 family DNA or RNA helicase